MKNITASLSLCLFGIALLLAGGCGLARSKGRINLGPTLTPDKSPARGKRKRRSQPDPPRPLSRLEKRLKAGIETEQARMVALLEEVVNISTGPGEFDGRRRVKERFGRELEALGFTLEWIRAPHVDLGPWGTQERGDHLVARLRRGGHDGLRVLLLGHVDTVHKREDGFVKLTVAGKKASGPGAFDMKGGIVVMIHALRALQREGLLDWAHITVILNSDEETGSLSSRAIIEDEARGADVALVFEGSRSHDLTISRPGQGQFKFLVHGHATHVGEMEKGVDAVHELALKIARLKKLTNIEKGITVNVSPITGGSSRNTVADEASCEIDLRYRHAKSGLDLFKKIKKIAEKSYVRAPGKSRESTRTDFWGTLHRPPMPRTREGAALANYFRTAARDLRISCRFTHSRTGSDANLTTHVGVPTIDGLGPIGDGAHTPSEYIWLQSLAERANITAIGLSRLLAAPPLEMLARARVRRPTASGER